MAPIAAFCIASELWPPAGLVFFVAVLTDLIDGPLARRRGTVSREGALIDHGADAFFVIVILASLAARGFFTPLSRTLQRHFVFLPCRYTGDSKRFRTKLDTAMDRQLRWMAAYRIDHLFDL